MQTIAEKIAAFRRELDKLAIAGYIIPRADAWQGEYVAARDERLSWITGFTGSAGSAVILHDKAALFTDSRYTIQAAEQIDSSLFEIHNITDKTPAIWIAENLTKGQCIGYDSWLHTPAQIDLLRKVCDDQEITCGAFTNPLERIWRDRPPRPSAPTFVHDLDYAGKTHDEKCKDLVEWLKEYQCTAVVLSDPHSICWLLNIRGGDVPCTPIAQCWAIVHDDGLIDLYIDPAKVDDTVQGHLGETVTIHELENIMYGLKELGNAHICIDPDGAPELFRQRLLENTATVVKETDPTLLPRARKNAVERQGTINAHIRDGKALSSFLTNLKKKVVSKTITELDVVKELESVRAQDPLYRGPSFDTIAGFGSNGAIVHYRAEEHSNKTLESGNLLLLDSGGQYPDGTTDVTRTIAIGTPTEEMRTRFTQVLIAHIDISSAIFPEGTSGAQIDALGRAVLWRSGIDFSHGTGHGVGSYLSVHEAGAGISPRYTKPLNEHVIVSIEPGYYKEGAYGIRIENLALVIDSGEKLEDGRKLLTFQPLTMCPFDKDLIDETLLDDRHKQWLDDYHDKVEKILNT